MMKNFKNKKKKGFTLIELIIVIAIIAILAAIAVPQFSKIRQKANVTADIANAKSIYTGVAVALAEDVLNSNVGVTVADTTTYVPVAIGDNIKENIGENIANPKAYQNTQFAYTIEDGDIVMYVIAGSGTVDANFTSDLEEGKTYIRVYPDGTGKYKAATTAN